MKKKTIPKFSSEAKEREFWAGHDATEFIDFSQVKSALFPNLKLSSKLISIRLPTTLLDSLKVLANKRDVPYQSLMKMLLAETVEREINKV